MQISKYLKIIWPYLIKHKRRVYFLIFLAILSSAIDAIIPYIYGRLVDIAIKPATTLELIFGILGLWLFLTLIVNWTNRYTSRKSSMIANDVSNDFYASMVYHVMKLPISFHREKKIGEILQRINQGQRIFQQKY